MNVKKWLLFREGEGEAGVGGRWGGGWGVSRDVAPMLNLPHTQGKLCHKTTFFGHAISSKQLFLHSFCLFEGIHNILKYMQIY